MGSIKLDANTMKLISMFESISNARVKDCIEIDNGFLFVTEPGQIGRAIGKNGANVKRLENALRKSVRVVEFSENMEDFVKGLLYPIVPNDVKIEGNIVTIFGKDAKTRGMIIGRDRSKIKQIQDILSRYFPVEDIKVA